MKQYRLFLLFFLYLAAFDSAFAQPLQVKWTDLAPPGDSAQEKLYQSFSEEDQGAVEWLLYMEITESEIIDPADDDLVKELAQLRRKIEARGFDFSAFKIAREKSMTRINTELDGKSIRLAGYLLPLEAPSGRVSEFLLVPYVGACIHVPPPPPNQIIFATIGNDVQDLPDTLAEFFAPVYVTGVLHAKSIRKELFLIDGSDSIDMGYTLKVEKIEKYSNFSGDKG